RSLVICPLRKRIRSVPEIRNFARSERSKKIACPASECGVIFCRMTPGSAAASENRDAIVLFHWQLHHSSNRRTQAKPPESHPADHGFPLRLSSRSARWHSSARPPRSVQVLHPHLTQFRVSISALPLSNRHLRGPSAFAQATDRELRLSHRDRDSGTNRSD